MNFNWIKTVLLAATATVSLNSFSQDLIARQAPIDRKLKSVDSLALQKQIRAEQSLYPGLDLYPNWNNEFVQAYGDAIVPESYTFDLTGFCMPTPNTRITDVFGYRPRRRRAHYGLDVKVYVGDTIRAAFDGKVRVVKNQGRRGYGKYVVIRHDNGLETVYGHLSKQLVEINQLVKAGEPIALGGNTGRSTGSHLHLRLASWEFPSTPHFCLISKSKISLLTPILSARLKALPVRPAAWRPVKGYSIKSRRVIHWAGLPPVREQV